MRLGTRKLTFTVEGEDETYNVSNVSVNVGDADSDFVSFGDAASGGSKAWTLGATIAQDPSTGSLWDYLWAHAGEEVDVVIAPNGGPVSASNPTFSGTVVVALPDGTILGGDADTSTTAVLTTDIEWPFTAKPTRSFT